MANHMPGPPLHELLLVQRAAIIDRFVTTTRAQGLPPEGATRTAIIDHLHAFLDDVATTLRREALGAPASLPEPQPARVHGAQRWGVGYDLTDLVREYGVLRRCIFSVAEEAGTPFELRTFERVAELLNLGIAEAVDEFVRRKDAALRATREEALTTVSHDLRGPLQVVTNAVPLLRSSLESTPVDPAEVAKLIASVERAATTMTELIAGLLDLSRIEAGRLPLSLGEHDIGALLHEAVEQVQPLAEQAGVPLALTLVPIGAARCDRIRTLQALANLLGNAVKFTPRGGAIELWADEVDGGWRVSVRDTGPGIPPEQQPFLFDRFWQAPETHQQGTGLGLAIVKGVVEAQGGGVGVESKVGRGSTFFFTLPRAGARR
jgi:signal transduction histidine kinase